MPSSQALLLIKKAIIFRLFGRAADRQKALADWVFRKLQISASADELNRITASDVRSFKLVFDVPGDRNTYYLYIRESLPRAGRQYRFGLDVVQGVANTPDYVL